MRLAVRATVLFVALAAGCAVENNANFCPGAPHNRCSERPAGDGGDGADLAPPPPCTESSRCPAAAPTCTGGQCSACTGPMDCAQFHAATPFCGPGRWFPRPSRRPARARNGRVR